MALIFSVNELETIYTNTGWAIKTTAEHLNQQYEVESLVKWCDEHGLINSTTSFASPIGCYWQQHRYTMDIIIKRNDIFVAFNLTWMNNQE